MSPALSMTLAPSPLRRLSGSESSVVEFSNSLKIEDKCLRQFYKTFEFFVSPTCIKCSIAAPSIVLISSLQFLMHPQAANPLHLGCLSEEVFMKKAVLYLLMLSLVLQNNVGFAETKPIENGAILEGLVDERLEEIRVQRELLKDIEERVQSSRKIKTATKALTIPLATVATAAAGVGTRFLFPGRGNSPDMGIIKLVFTTAGFGAAALTGGGAFVTWKVTDSDLDHWTQALEDAKKRLQLNEEELTRVKSRVDSSGVDECIQKASPNERLYYVMSLEQKKLSAELGAHQEKINNLKDAVSTAERTQNGLLIVAVPIGLIGAAAAAYFGRTSFEILKKRESFEVIHLFSHGITLGGITVAGGGAVSIIVTEAQRRKWQNKLDEAQKTLDQKKAYSDNLGSRLKDLKAQLGSTTCLLPGLVGHAAIPSAETTEVSGEEFHGN